MAIITTVVSIIFLSPALGVAKDVSSVKSPRQVTLERKFGKFYGSFEKFEIYGVKKTAKPNDSVMAILSGYIVYPPDKRYTSVSISAEVTTKFGSTIRCSTSDEVSKSFAWIQDVNTENPSPSDIGFTDFKWTIPFDAEASSLRIKRIVAK